MSEETILTGGTNGKTTIGVPLSCEICSDHKPVLLVGSSCDVDRWDLRREADHASVPPFARITAESITDVPMSLRSAWLLSGEVVVLLAPAI